MSNENGFLPPTPRRATTTTCNLTDAMAEVGANGVLIMPPFYFKKRMTEEAVESHYLTVANKCKMPIIIYNMPMVTGIDISTKSLARLAQHPKISGVKDSDIRKCAVTAQETKGKDFDVLIGSAGYLLPALISGKIPPDDTPGHYLQREEHGVRVFMLDLFPLNNALWDPPFNYSLINFKVRRSLMWRGCSGGINGLAGILGLELCHLYKLFQEKKFEEARDLHIRICGPDTLLLSELGVPGLKAAMDMMGLQGGLCRSPILPPTDLDKQRIQLTLKKAGFL